MKLLANEHIAGLKVYEPGRPIEEVARELGLPDATGFDKLASNENELGPSPKALAAMQASACEMHRYPDGGCFYLKQKTAAQLNLEPEQLLFGCGSNELIVFLGHVFLNPETHLIMGANAFAVYFLVAEMYGSKAIRVPMPNYTHDLEAMRRAVTPETRLVAICNPNNPTGTLVGQAEMDRFMDTLPEDVLAVFDEAYFELLPEEQRPDALKYVREGRENAVVLRTFSKAYGLAGLRIGFAAGHPDLIALLNKVRQPFNVSAMAQTAAMAALDDEAHLEQSGRMVRQGLAFLEKECAARGLEFVPSVANFMLIKTGRGRERFAALQQRGVIVRPMDGYGFPDHIRVSIGTPEQNTRFIQALDEVLRNNP